MKKLILTSMFFCLLCQIVTAQQDALLEPADGKVYHGTQTIFSSHYGYLTALDDSTIQPAVRGIFLSIPGTRGPAKLYNSLRSYFASADSIGFIPEVGLFMVSDTATDSVIAVSTKLDYILDSIISISKAYGKRMFVRIGGEFNGSGPGWNGGGYHPYYYVTAFRKITDMYESKGFRDSIATVWCYEPDAANDFDSADSKGSLWYPGDNYVDWFGLDVFDAAHFDQSLPDKDFRGEITRKGKSERFLTMARAKNKPVYLNETSAIRRTITADSLDSANDWATWYAKFWQFMDMHTEIKGFNYINQDWENTGYPGWGDARIQNSTYITSWYRQEMHRSKYIHLYSSQLTGVDKSIQSKLNKLYLSYPNPAHTVLNILLPSQDNSEIKVLNQLGKSVIIAQNQSSLDISQLQNGMYFLRITYGTKQHTPKFIKQ